MSELEAAVDLVQLAKLDEVVARHHRVFTRVAGRLRTFREIAPQKINDADGHIGYLLRFFPDTHELGARIVEALRAEGIACRTRGRDAAPDWHLYRHMFPVILPAGSPGLRWHRGDCPVADDLHDRAVGVPLDQWYSQQDCDCIAAGINKVLSAYCTPDASARPWI
ncbi:MAG: hypothetical protein AMJ81_11885 [Phycisphaerae bacterium SM23_33]|nr:MAG: hypothetical protein AMJ81_11885 [Phycisphaerae bacterium SM23_33]